MIDHPTPEQLPGLKGLWKQAFGDSDLYISAFFDRAFSRDRCLSLLRGGEVLGMIHWLPCGLGEQKLAYIYAFAVAESCRGQGLGRRLLNAAHRLLELEGYSGILLLPEEGLGELYRKFGYAEACTFNEGISGAGSEPTALHRITAQEYAALRPKYLPQNGVIQQGPFLPLLELDYQFYRGADFLFTARSEKDHLCIPELLGNAQAVPGILASLGHTWARFRTPGPKHPGAMYRPLIPDALKPGYFSFPLD